MRDDPGHLVRFLLRRPGVILAAVAGLVAFLGWHAFRIRFDFTIDNLFQSRGSERAEYERFRQDFGGDDRMLYVAFAVPDAFDPVTLAVQDRLRSRLGGIRGVRSVLGLRDALDFYRGLPVDAGREVASSPLFRGTLFSEDGRTSCLGIRLADEAESVEERRRIIGEIETVLRSTEGVEFHLTGLPTIENEYIELTRRDLVTFMPIAGGVFLILLTLFFRSVAGVLIPPATVAVSILCALGLMSLRGMSLGLLSSLIPNLILILGISDAVHILARYQEELTTEPDRRRALERTLSLMVAACFLTSFTTAAGFASLATVDVPAIREFGWVTAAGIMTTYLLTILLVPSVLNRLPRFPGRAPGARLHRVMNRLLGWIADVDDRHAAKVGLVTLLLVVAATFGMARLQRDSSWLHDFRRDNPVYRAHAFFEERLGGAFSVDLVLSGPVRDPAWLKKAEVFQAEVSRWGRLEGARVGHAVGFVDFIKEINRARQGFLAPRALPGTAAETESCLRLYAAAEKKGGGFPRMADVPLSSCRVMLRMKGVTSRMLDAFRRDLEEMRRRQGDGFSVEMTGKTWLAKRTMDGVVGNVLSSIGLAAAVIFGSMVVLFRSLKVGVAAILPNALPILFTAGLMGWLGIDLNFSTVTVFSISLGIAVDTTIHYLARLRLEIGKDGDPRGAMRRAVRGAGGAMILSTALLVFGFGAILTSNFVFTFHFGLLGGFALVTALLCDLFVTPVLFRFFGPREAGKRGAGGTL